MINLDMGKYDFLRGALPATVASGKTILDIVTDLRTNSDGEESDATVFDLLIQSGQYRHSTEHYEGDPLGALTYPVFSHLNLENRTVVDVLFTTIYWRFLFSNILPKNIRGIVCVLENSLVQQYAYGLDGHDAFFLHCR